jgi:protocatechuate 3,4-dioxygenase beta subunit
MFRLKLVSALPALALVLAIQISAQTPSSISKEGTAVIAGTVTLKGEPARGVSVALQTANDDGSANTIRARTDEAGRYRFERIRAGRYSINAMAPGYVTSGGSQYGAQSRAINVSENDKVENLNLSLVFGGIITGRITDARGGPVVGESLQLARVNEQGKSEQLFLGSNGNMYSTDDRGIYRLYGVPAGRYLLSVGFGQRPNSITVTSLRVFYPRTYHPNVTAEEEAKVIEVSEGQETTGIDIRVGELKKTYDVSGRVLYAENGQPGVGLAMMYGVPNIINKNISAMGSTGDRTNPQGEFRMQSVLPGKYAIFARPNQGDNLFSDAVPFEVVDGDVGGIEIKLRRGSSISGVAAMEGVADPQLAARLTEIRLYVLVTSSELSAPGTNFIVNLAPNGGFQFTGLRAGKAQIGLSATPATRSFSILRIERDGALQRDGIDVGAGEQISNVRDVLGYGTGAVRGTLRIVGGAIPETARVWVGARRVDSGQQVGSLSQADQRGYFRLDGLAPGEYEIYLSVIPRSSDPGLDDLIKLAAGVKERVTVNNDAEAQVNLVFDLARKGGN